MLIRRVLAGTALMLFSATLPLAHAQAPAILPPAQMAADANPSFEVATVRPARASGSENEHIDGHRVGLEDYPVIDMISFAYGVHQTQVVNAPAWFSERYDVDGVADAEGQPSLHQMQQMIQKLLADRFALKFHHDKRELSLYAITIAKGGPKLKTSTADPKGLPDIGGTGDATQRTRKFVNITMRDFALTEQFQIGKPVIDQTGLTGHYDFTLTWSRDDAPPDANGPPSFFTAIQEQLGLKMEPKKDLAYVLVIDHAEKPSEN